MALATNTTPGSIMLQGDLTGSATSPQLRPSGVVPGTYDVASIVVDNKGRVIYASQNDTSLAGDVDGSVGNAQLIPSGVAAGEYTNAIVTVNAKGFVTEASNGETVALAGGVTGPIDNLTIPTTGVSADTYTNASLSVNTLGFVTGATSNEISLQGDAVGEIDEVKLKPSGVTAGSYNHTSITVNKQGVITAASSSTAVLDGQARGNLESVELVDVTTATTTSPAPTITVDQSGRIIHTSSNSLSLAGDVSGSLYSNTLPVMGVVPGTYVGASVTVTKEGFVKSIDAVNDQLNGVITGTISNNTLSNTTVVPGTYQLANITVGSDGRLTAARSGSLASATDATLGGVKIDNNGVRVLQSGAAVLIPARSTTMGGVKLNYQTFESSSPLTVNNDYIASQDTGAYFDVAQILPVTSTDASVLVPDLELSDMYICNGNSLRLQDPINSVEGSTLMLRTTREWSDDTLTPAVIPESTSIAYGNATYCALGSLTYSKQTSSVAVSSDAINWHAYALPLQTWRAVVWVESIGKFVAVASGIAAVSTNGTSWTTTASSLLVDIAYVQVANNVIFAFTNNYSKSVAYSTDGVTWTTVNLPENTNWSDVAYVGDRYVVSAMNGNLAYSTDLSTFFRYNQMFSGIIDMVTIGGKLVMIGTASVNQQKIFNCWGESTDYGKTWKTYPLDNPYRLISNGNTAAIVSFDRSKYFVSTDGSTWRALVTKFGTEGRDIGLIVNNELLTPYGGKLSISPTTINSSSYYKYSNTAPSVGDVQLKCVQVNSIMYCTYEG